MRNDGLWGKTRAMDTMGAAMARPRAHAAGQPASASVRVSETDDHRRRLVAASRRLHLMIDLHVQGRQGRQGRGSRTALAG